MLVPEMLEPSAHPVGGVGIERRGRLVEQQNFRTVKQRLGKRDSGLLSGGKLARRPVEKFAEFEIGGNFIEKTVTWKSKSDLASLAGRTVRLRFALRAGKLFAFQFLR